MPDIPISSDVAYVETLKAPSKRSVSDVENQSPPYIALRELPVVKQGGLGAGVSMIKIQSCGSDSPGQANI